MIVSASALVRHCGYQRALRRERKPTPEQQHAMDRGTRFHACIEQWAKTGELPWLDDAPEMQGWLDLLAMDWRPPPGGAFEEAWGLGIDPRVSDETPGYVAVDEPQPHVYVPKLAWLSLLTAGRADVAWVDSECALRVADWKTGKWPVTEAEHNLQANAAGIALALRWGLASYFPGIYYARDGYWDWGPRVVIGTPAFDRIWGEIREAALLDESPRPGPWCAKCWERKGCQHAEAATGVAEGRGCGR